MFLVQCSEHDCRELGRGRVKAASYVKCIISLGSDFGMDLNGLVKLDSEKRQSPMVADFSHEVFNDESKDEMRQLAPAPSKFGAAGNNQR